MVRLRRIGLAAVVPLLLFGMQTTKVDPRRPACTSADCRKIRSFLKARYCGRSPWGNGPDDGCELKLPKSQPGAAVIAHVECEWVDSKNVCRQLGRAPDGLRTVLVGELHRLGLPPTEDKRVYFTIWRSTSEWSLAEASYSRAAEPNLAICQVIVMFDPHLQAFVLHEVPLQKTGYDVSHVVTWGILGLTEVDGDGQPEAILDGSEYEDHWIEVHGIRDGLPRMIFSGLGYWL